MLVEQPKERLMERYSYRSRTQPDGVYCWLLCLDTLNVGVKTFFFAGKGEDSLQRINAHVNTLTDEQCDMWLQPNLLIARAAAEKEKQRAQRLKNIEDAAAAKAAKLAKKQKNPTQKSTT